MPDFTREQLLKLRLLADGIRIDASAERAWRDRFDGPMTMGEYVTTAGVTLILGEDLYVNALLVDPADESVPLLRARGDEMIVHDAHGEVPVRPVPVPAFHHKTLVDRELGTSEAYTNYGITHTDRCRVSPISGCAWKCGFCDIPYQRPYRKRDVAHLLEVIQAASRDPLTPARHVLVSGGTPRVGGRARDDGRWIDGVFERIAAESPLPVEVMMAPRMDFSHPAWLQSVGVQSVSINLEVSDEERARKLMPAKARLGRRHVLAYIERAVESFGVGAVQSLIVVGPSIEPLESTLQGVRDLLERGCIPVLSPFRPHPSTPLAREPAATRDEIVAAYRATRALCEQYGPELRPGPRCVACHHNTLTLPEPGPFYFQPAG